jgi:general secretion pathway protein C
MINALRRGTNAVLFVVACLLAADTANAVFAAIVLPPPTREAESGGVESVVAPTWADRQAILDRNVFASSTLAPAVTDEPMDLEATQLPLTLLGTAASEEPRLAWAAIQDRGTRSTLIVGIGGSIQDKATVVRIERRRVVLLEDGVHRELTFEENELKPRLPTASLTPSSGPSARRAQAMARAAQRRQARLQQVSENTFEMPREDVQAVMSNPADLLSQARILPKYEQGQMRGVQVSQIKPGSVFEQMGLQEGDLVTSVNGVAIDSPEQSALVLQQLSSGNAIEVGIVGANGQTSTKTLQPQR